MSECLNSVSTYIPEESLGPLIDVSMAIENGMAAWPGDPELSVEEVMSLENGDAASVSRLTCSVHTGTHVDALSHFKLGALSIESMALETYVGPARLIEITDGKEVTASELKQYDWAGIRRVLFKTQNSLSDWGKMPFNPDFVSLHPDAASFLVGKGIRLIGIDYLSVESYHAKDAPTHHLLMDASVYIVEGLYFKGVEPGWYDFMCLPLKISGCDGAPARAVLRRLTSANPSEVQG